MKIFIVLTLLLINHSVFAACTKSTIKGAMNSNIEGFCVVFSGKALPENDILYPKMLIVLKEKLSKIKQLSPALFKASSIATIWVTNNNWQPSAAVTHHSKEWLIEKKMNPEMATGIEITSTSNFLKWSNDKDQPMMIGHEMAHIVHEKLSAEKKNQILEAYTKAMNKKLYDVVDYHHGEQKLKAYAANNELVYFAELSEAWLGANDYFPYTREDLKKHDPEAYILLSEIYKD